MKIYPSSHLKNFPENNETKINNTDSVTKVIALIVVFLSIAFIFLKILFF